MSPIKNPYDVLDIDKKATRDEISFALLCKIKEHHPDANMDKGDISAAIEALEAFRAIMLCLDGPPKTKKFHPRGGIKKCLHCSGSRFCDCKGCVFIGQIKTGLPSRRCGHCG